MHGGTRWHASGSGANLSSGAVSVNSVTMQKLAGLAKASSPTQHAMHMARYSVPDFRARGYRCVSPKPGADRLGWEFMGLCLQRPRVPVIHAVIVCDYQSMPTGRHHCRPGNRAWQANNSSAQSQQCSGRVGYTGRRRGLAR